MKYLIILNMVFLLLGCGKPLNEIQKSISVNKMKWLYTADPKIDVKLAGENGDYRFIGIYGYGLSVPLIDPSCLDFDRDIKAIEGTSDVISGYEHAKLSAIAVVYAKHYNRMMVEYLIENNRVECEY